LSSFAIKGHMNFIIKKRSRMKLTWIFIEAWKSVCNDKRGAIMVPWHLTNTKNTPMNSIAKQTKKEEVPNCFMNLLLHKRKKRKKK
jgi:hypothetical protein